MKKIKEFTIDREEVRGPYANNRKLKSEEILTKEKIPFISHLPPIRDETEVKLRSKNEIIERAICLLAILAKSPYAPKGMFEAIVKRYNLENKFSPKENNFINNDNPSEQLCSEISWRYEALWVLLWALGYAKDLGRPDKMCDVNFVRNCVLSRSLSDFILEANVRTVSEILDKTDLIYRYHWAVRDAEINKRFELHELNGDVVFEWHYTLNWLINYF